MPLDDLKFPNFEALKYNPQKNVASKLEGGGDQALLAGPIKIELFWGFPKDDKKIKRKYV